MVEPETLGGRPELAADDDVEVAAVITEIEEIEEIEASHPGAENSFGALYGHLADDNMIAALATEARTADPRKELTAAFATFGAGAQLTGLAPADTGTPGGLAECGTFVDPEGGPVICGWADEGSLGIVIWLYEPDDRARAEFPGLRAEIEKKPSPDGGR